MFPKEKDSKSNNYRNTELIKYIPNDFLLEKKIIGSIFIYGDDVIHKIVNKLPKSDFFHSAEHQLIYNVILRLYESKNNIDLHVVINSLRSSDLLDKIGGEFYLIEMQRDVISDIYVENWCDILINLYLLRKMIFACNDGVELCYNTDLYDINDSFYKIENDVFNVRDFVINNSSMYPIDVCVNRAVDYVNKLSEKDNDGFIPTNIANLDNIITGMRRQELIVVAARPSMGKTSLILNIASKVAFKDKKIALFSLEMSLEQVTNHIIYSLAKLSERDLLIKSINTSANWAEYTKCAGELKELKEKFFIDDTPGLSINELKAKALRLKSKYNIDIIFIDYLQLMHAEISRNDNREVEVSKISSGLKALAKQLNIPIFVAAQLNRQAEQQDSPKLSHLRESGAIEQDADIVMLLNRDRDEEKNNETESINATLIVEKNRNGRVGTVDLLFFPKYTTFESRSDREYND